MTCENCGSTLKVSTHTDEEERLFSGKIRRINLCEECFEDMQESIKDMYADEWGEY